VADVDAAATENVTLAIDHGTLNLSLAGGASISSGANGSGNLTITGSIAQLNTALATLIYTAPNTGTAPHCRSHPTMARPAASH